MSELTTLFKNTADAIRSKTGDTATMQASQFPAKIQGISVGISQDEADARYLRLSGGTMTGALILNGAPTANNQAATKAYVDSKAGGLTLLAEKTVRTDSAQERYTVNISDLFSSITNYNSELFLGLEFNGTMTLTGNSATTKDCGITAFTSELSFGNCFFMATVEKGTPLTVSYNGIKRLIVVPRYSSSGTTYAACIEGGAFSDGLIVDFISKYEPKGSLKLNSGATITIKIYHK